MAKCRPDTAVRPPSKEALHFIGVNLKPQGVARDGESFTVGSVGLNGYRLVRRWFRLEFGARFARTPRGVGRH
jgi:hypothetical protein